MRIISTFTASLLCISPIHNFMYPQVAYAQEVDGEIFTIKCDNDNDNEVVKYSNPKEFIDRVKQDKEEENQQKKEIRERKNEIVQKLLGVQQEQALVLEDVEKKRIEEEKRLEEERIEREKNNGVYTITAYCACVQCCGKDNGITASGVKAKEGVTVANGKLPFGTKIHIEGVGERIVQDRGVGAKSIDVYFTSHSKAKQFGMKQHYVKILT